MHSGNDRGWFYLAFAALGVGILSKGVGFLPILVVVPFLVARWRGATLARISARQWLLGAGILVALLLCWFLPLVSLAHGNSEIREYLEEILLRQTAQRYSAAWQHREPFWFFITQIPKYWAPLSLLLPWLLPMWWRRLKRNDSRYVLLLGWASLVLLFFSLSTGKRELYMLPALPAVALAAAAPLHLLLRRRWLQRAMAGTAIFLIVMTSAAGLIRLTGVLPKSALMQWPSSAGFALVGAAVVGLVGFVLLRRRPIVVRWLAVYLAIIACFHSGLMPLTDGVESGQPAMIALSRASAPNALALIDWNERQWLYSETTLLHNGIRSPNDIDLCSTAPIPITWVMNSESAKRLQLPTTPSFAVEHSEPMVALTPRPLTMNCTSSQNFRYRFAWNPVALQRLARCLGCASAQPKLKP